jgi:hypothetical protein
VFSTIFNNVGEEQSFGTYIGQCVSGVYYVFHVDILEYGNENEALME